METITETLEIVFLGIPEWHKEALCADPWHDPDLWFTDDLAQAEEAKAICRRCMVQAQCLTSALDEPEQWGIRAGKTKNQRTRIKNKLHWRKK